MSIQSDRDNDERKFEGIGRHRFCCFGHIPLKLPPVLSSGCVSVMFPASLRGTRHTPRSQFDTWRSTSGVLGREDLGAREDFADGLLQAAFGHADVIRGDARAPMRGESIHATRRDGVVKLGVDQAFDGPTKRFGMITDHDNSFASVGRDTKRPLPTPEPNTPVAWTEAEPTNKKEESKRYTDSVDPFHVPTELADGLEVESLPQWFNGTHVIDTNATPPD
jgi:hypothetical protein